MAWRRKAATMFVGVAGAAFAFGAQRSVMIKTVGDSDDKEKDWRRAGNRFQIMSNKVGSIIHSFVAPQAPPPDWEREIASMPGLVQNFDVSHMAQSSTDGLLFVGLPRVYQPASGYSEEQQKEDEQRRASSKSAGAEDAKQESNSSQAVEVKRDAFGQPAGLPGRDTFCVWHFGKDAVGHPATVHGGAIAMAIDESCGHAFMSLGRGPGYTAFLHVNYRKPMPAGNAALVKVVVEKIDRRKGTEDFYALCPSTMFLGLPCPAGTDMRMRPHLGLALTCGCGSTRCSSMPSSPMARTLTSVRGGSKFADAECLFVIPRPATAPVDPPGYMSASVLEP